MTRFSFLAFAAVVSILPVFCVRGDAPDADAPASPAVPVEVSPAVSDEPATVDSQAASDPAIAESAVAVAANTDQTTAPAAADAVVAEKPVEPPAPSVEEQALARESATPPQKAYVIPVKGAIGSPTLYILRRALKEALTNGVDLIVLDMDTPGGELQNTLEIMDALSRFKGETLTYVNTEAISAGSFIAISTDDIYFEENGQIGAAEVVSGTGQDIPESMKRKLQSYINAKVRVYAKNHRYRADVMRAMTDPDFELKIGDTVLSPKGELLSLTASEAMTPYGDPPEPLFGAGIASSVEDVLSMRYGAGVVEIKAFEVTWSERLAQFMQGVAPILVSIGVLLLFIEFKTPSFGLIGSLGILCLVIVFASNYVAGLAGYEPLILFVVGLLLIAVELLILPGFLIPAFLGICCVLVSLVWSMADLWPEGEGGRIVIAWDEVQRSTGSLLLSLLGSLVGMILVVRLLPKTPLWSRVALQGTSPDPDPVLVGGGRRSDGGTALPPVGTVGIALTPMIPSGQIEVEGRRFEAMAQTGSIDRGDRVVVAGFRQFSVLVKKAED